MRYLGMALWIVATVGGAVLVGLHYEGQTGAVVAGAVVGLLCGVAWGALAATWVVRRPHTDDPAGPPIEPMQHPTLLLLDQPEIGRAALEWNRDD